MGNDSSVGTSSFRSGGVWVVVDLVPTKRGSMEQQLLALSARLRADDIPVTCVFASAPAPWMAAALSMRGVKTRTLDFRTRSAPFTFLRWVAEDPPALVHFHFVSAYSPLVAIAHAAGARTVVTEHFPLGYGYVTPGMVRPRLISMAVEVAKRLRAGVLNRLVDRRVAVSRFVATTVGRAEFVAPEQLSVIENGIELERFAAAAGERARRELVVGDAPLIVCVSRLAAWEKGIDTLIRAHARVRRGAILLLVGAGPDEQALRALTDELGTGAAVRFLGIRDDVEHILAAADVVVQPSRYDEAFGLSVVEAMAAARPLVVTDSGAMPELLEMGAAGLIVPKDDPAAMAQAIVRLVDDRALATRVAARARQCAGAYAMDRFVARVVRLYHEVCPALDVTRRRKDAARRHAPEAAAVASLQVT